MTLSLTAILLGVLNILIWIAVIIFVAVIAEWILGWLTLPIPENVKRAFLAVVALIALAMLVALLLGVPVSGPIMIGR
jgi:hypothetical protein